MLLWHKRADRQRECSVAKMANLTKGNSAMRNLIIALAAASFIAGSTPSIAAPCRDAKGKFVKCPSAKAKPTHCRDAKGKFAKCGTKGARPA